MPVLQKPTNKGRASRVLLADWKQEALTLSTYRVEYLFTFYSLRPEMVALAAAVAFGGGASHG